jgi:hypothetical protein
VERVAGTVFALLILAWGLATLVAGLRSSQIVWVVIGLLLAGFGCLFLPAIAALWRGALGEKPEPPPRDSHAAH